jgi:hypothetical protein
MATQWTAGLTDNNPLPAATLNRIGASWESYTPTWTNLTVGNGTSEFKYSRINKVVCVAGKLTFGSTTSVTGSIIRMGLPVNNNRLGFVHMGTVGFDDFGVNQFFGSALAGSLTEAYLYALNVAGTYPSYTATTSTVPFTWTTNDFITVYLTYEAA